MLINFHHSLSFDKGENTLVTVAIEPSEIPWVKVFTKRKVKEFSQCTTAEKAEIFRILDITEKLMFVDKFPSFALV
jgi:diadenosine tetraphosphate (Ap4A) HIT family hydrolase